MIKRDFEFLFIIIIIIIIINFEKRKGPESGNLLSIANQLAADI